MGKQVKAPYGVYEVLSAEYQRNGSSGIGFFVGLALCVEGECAGETFQIVTLYSRDSEATQYDGAPVFVTNANNDLTEKFMGDNFIEVAWAIVDTVNEQWDANLAALAAKREKN